MIFAQQFDNRQLDEWTGSGCKYRKRTFPKQGRDQLPIEICKANTMDHLCSEYRAKLLFKSKALSLLDVRCSGDCRHPTASRACPVTHLVFPYHGTFVRHIGMAESVAEANQLVFINGDEEYQVSHTAEGGDACLLLNVDAELLMELSPAGEIVPGEKVRFRQPSVGIGPRSQALLAKLRYRFLSGAVDPLETESLLLELVAGSLRKASISSSSNTYGQQKLVNRAKLLLASEPGRRWALSEIADQVGGVSPAYLTHVFARVEGIPLYQYQLRLRLARALHLVGERSDLTELAFDMGFSSHSHFSAAFRQQYGRSPREFRGRTQVR